MDADALLHPRGPLPPGVYWRRRLVTLVVLAVALAVLLRSCAEPAADRLGADRSPSPTGTPSPGVGAVPSASGSAAASRSPSPSVSPARAPGGPCAPADLELTATSNATTYAPGVRPILRLTVRNTGTVACTRDLGQAARELRVTSGSDRVWSSDDCAPGGAADVETLQPGASRSFPVAWARLRSAPGCPGGRTAAPPGTYRVVGRLGDLTVTGTAFTLR